MTELCDLTATEARRRIGTKEISPVELLEACITRTEAVNPTVNSMVTTCYDRARAEARVAEKQALGGEPLGLLHGLPFGSKDLESTGGVRTTMGSQLFADNVPDQDQGSIAEIRDNGGILIGKTNTPEAGFVGDTYNPTFGPTRNPWNTERSPGGSSGGTSAAIASGLVPLATGSDGGGSIRIPSTVCGLSGFKPSQGRIPHGPAPMGAADLSTVGPMARRIRDVALALDVVVGPSADDLRSLPHPGASFRAVCDAPQAPRRLLYCASTDGTSTVDDEIAARTAEAVDTIRAAGVEVVEVDGVLPDAFSPFLLLFFGGMVPAYRHLMGTDAFDAITPDLQRILLMADERLTPDSIEEARKAAQANSVMLAEAMVGFDALITPTVIGHTPVSQRGGVINGNEELGWVGNTFAFNVTRRPAGTTPIGLTADGMPLGLQIVGHQLDDLRTVELTAWTEDVFGLDLVAPFPA